jgi:DNA-directed RNA polymerase specialized sigma subunit
VAGRNPLPRLRILRDEIRRIDALRDERDRLIRKAAKEGKTQQQIADAAGLSQGRVNQIVISG